MGSDRYPFAFDATNFKKGYDRLYFDKNRNGDLTDDPVIKANSKFANFGYTHSSFPQVDLKVTVEGKKIDYAFRFRSGTHKQRNAGDETYMHASLNASAYRHGQIDLDGQTHRIVLIDFNSNGRFDDCWKVDSRIITHDGAIYPTNGDLLLIDPDTKNRNYYGYDITDRQGTTGRLQPRLHRQPLLRPRGIHRRRQDLPNTLLRTARRHNQPQRTLRRPALRQNGLRQDQRPEGQARPATGRRLEALPVRHRRDRRGKRKAAHLQTRQEKEILPWEPWVPRSA